MASGSDPVRLGYVTLGQETGIHVHPPHYDVERLGWFGLVRGLGNEMVGAKSKSGVFRLHTCVERDRSEVLGWESL